LDYDLHQDLLSAHNVPEPVPRLRRLHDDITEARPTL
jgi:hypothetical protein